MERRQGRVQVIAEIGTDGKAISCLVTSTSGHADLDLATCEGVYRTTFIPATDRSGEAIPGSFTTAVTWNLLP
ncbi:TonB family protein [Escherichia coli]|uniref:TonB family protein n=1 Tax=Escherichia coli TaxID=562 RepID=UPI0034D95899